MRNTSLKNIAKILLTVVILLLFTKVDYRLNEIAPGSIQDDSVYYYTLKQLQSILILTIQINLMAI